MLRFLAVSVVCFLAPFLVYAGWRQFFANGSTAGMWSYRVLTRLSAIGIVIVLIAILALVSFSGGGAGTTYHPAEFRDGVLVPGGFD
jgi:heme/copper-type cytochrome/quinol oxidase subunit 2